MPCNSFFAITVCPVSSDSDFIVFLDIKFFKLSRATLSLLCFRHVQFFCVLLENAFRAGQALFKFIFTMLWNVQSFSVKYPKTRNS